MEPLSRPAAGEGVPILSVLPAFADGEVTPEALERMLAALVVHPEGGDCERAWVLRWEPRRGALVLVRAAERGAAPPLEQALGAARRDVPEDPARRGEGWSETPDGLAAPLAEAWRGSTLAFAEGDAPGGGPWAGASRTAALVLRRGGWPHGLLVATWSGDGADAARRARLDAVRQVAEAALGAQGRAADARRRARHVEAFAELARTSVSAINLAEALHLLARLATTGCGARGAVVFRAAGAGAPKVEVSYGPASVRDRVPRAFAAEAAACLASAEGRAGEGGPPEVAGEVGPWQLVPLAAYGAVEGALLVHDGPERAPHEDDGARADATFLRALADHAALLLAHARAVDAARGADRARGDRDARSRELERLAAVSEVAARVAQEAKSPLASIAAFARRAQREAGAEDPAREYLEIVVRETERLEAMLTEQRDLAQQEHGRLRMQSLNVVVQEALQHAAETLVRRRVRLMKKLAPDLPNLLLDAPRIRRVVENVVQFALESVPIGGRIKVESRRAGGHVAVDVAFDGSRARGDLLEQLFVPFTAGGAAVGLGVAQQIVREHGGEVRVRGEGEWGTVLTFTLPVAGNEDRRGGADRRNRRPDRRGRIEGPGGGV